MSFDEHEVTFKHYRHTFVFAYCFFVIPRDPVAVSLCDFVSALKIPDLFKLHRMIAPCLADPVLGLSSVSEPVDPSLEHQPFDF